MQTLFDMAQFHFPARLGQNTKNAPQCFDGRIYSRALNKKERTKHANFTEFESRDDYVYDILKELTGFYLFICVCNFLYILLAMLFNLCQYNSFNPKLH